MKKFLIEGGTRLQGVVEISGSKNATLPILAATLLSSGRTIIRNAPNLEDVRTLMTILQELGVSVERRASDGSIEAKVVSETESVARYEHVSRMRASICVLGPLLAKRGYAKVSLPGGCVIGLRPIDLHLKGLRALGANIEIEHGYVVARARRLRGTQIYLGGAFGSSVLGTANVMMAATLAEGKTIIENAACEPEVQDLANFLNSMGATITGIGTPRLEITGVPELRGTRYSVINDRIEAGTFILAAAITRGNVLMRNISRGCLTAVIDKLREVGVPIQEEDGDLRVLAAEQRFHSVDITTLPFPGYPTDLQAQLMALLSTAEGISVITEKIYPDRFMHMAELNRMGANVRKEGPSAIIAGVPKLSGCPVMASDLRASAALVLAGLVAEGETEINRIYHIDRGYERIEEKLRALGARIQRVEE